MAVAAEAKDLGVGTTAGVRRTARYLQARICSVRGRVWRIKGLNRVNKKCAKLINTGAWPQATYGKEAFGISPAQMRQVRALAAAAATGEAPGKCPTTAIWLSLGPEQDPMIRLVEDIIHMWFSLWGTMDMVDVSRAWWTAKGRFFTSPSPWSTVKGPVGAIIGILHNIGWKPISPFKWVDQDEGVWQYTGGPAPELFEEIREHLELSMARVLSEAPT